MPLATFTVTFTSELKKFVVNSVAPDKIEDQLKLFNESTIVEKIEVKLLGKLVCPFGNLVYIHRNIHACRLADEF